ncbi:MAG: nucleoside triphosphate pyrophosphohydrolase [Fibrobacterota bacterium]
MSTDMDRLISIVARLREPDGCPWDQKQTHTSIRHNLIEESYELFEALDEGAIHDIREELGDILLQVVFHTQMESEQNNFTFDDVARAISDKLIRRHPHVFEKTEDISPEQVLHNWEQIKKEEAGKENRTYITDGVPRALPSLLLAEKIQQKARKAGFDWNATEPVLNKVREETEELIEAVESGCDTEMIQKELGDLLFSLVNVARHLDISAESGLRHSISTFINRLKFVEDHFNCDHQKMTNTSLDELDKIWEKAKRSESSCQ